MMPMKIYHILCRHFMQSQSLFCKQTATVNSSPPKSLQLKLAVVEEEMQWVKSDVVNAVYFYKIIFTLLYVHSLYMQ